MNNLQFTEGAAIIKQGRRILAKVYDRAIFYPLHKIPSKYSFQYSIEMMGGAFECADLTEVNRILEKYLPCVTNDHKH